MGLKQIKDEDRVVFLRLFVESMLSHPVQMHISKKAVDDEKIKQKILEPFPENGLSLDVSGINSVLEKEVFGNNDEVKSEIKEVKLIVPEKKKRGEIFKRKVLAHLSKVSEKVPNKKFKRSVVQSKVTKESGMTVINRFLGDKAIQFVECPGPGKNLIVKKRNKIQLTKIILGPLQISEVIASFASRARIPVVGGILKAAVGDLIISAVESQFVGSRFILTRKTPYSLIGGARGVGGVGGVGGVRGVGGGRPLPKY